MRTVCNPSQLVHPIAIVGAGGTGSEVIKILIESTHLIKLVVDNDEQQIGKSVGNLDLKVQPIASLKTFEGEILIACAGNYHLQNQLSELGIPEVNYYYNYSANVKMFYNWNNEKSSFHSILDELADIESINSLIAILDSVGTGEFLNAFRFVVPRPFFGLSGHRIRPGERILDIGSYRGRHFASLTLSELEMIDSIQCVEPDSGNNKYLVELFSEDKTKTNIWLSKLNITNKAVKAFNGVGVSNSNGISNTIQFLSPDNHNEANVSKVDVVTLNEFESFKPTLITVDVEGDEMELLNGGLDLILNLKPRIAISTYHKSEHLLSIHDFFNKLNTPKEFRFRLHDFGYMDQVLYVDFI